ncbi:MAG: beta-ketoacyl-[acyl-carrier-protein] synthase family protein [Bryobacteraceae bacterium]
MKRRVAVTGAGVVCAAGSTADETWASLRAGRSAIGRLEHDWARECKYHVAAVARDFDPAQHFDARELVMFDRFAQFALAACAEAVRTSGIVFDGPRTAIVMGTSGGGQASIDEGFVELYRKGNPRVHPLTIPKTMSNAGTSHIAMKYGLTGPAWAVSTACASSSHAIGQAFWMVRHGLADAAIAGGSEAPLNPGFWRAWEAMRVMAPDTCRPFSRNRKGMILGEGGAVLILETLDRARARGAPVLAEICGFGMSADAHHLTQPLPEGAAAAMRMALADAGLRAEDIGYVNAHGTGTPANDVAESRALVLALGEHGRSVPVSSTKSVHGHALGAAGALEAFATVMALHTREIPPTANFVERDPECDVNLISSPTPAPGLRAALSNSFAFGGLNAVLAFRDPAGL